MAGNETATFQNMLKVLPLYNLQLEPVEAVEGLTVANVTTLTLNCVVIGKSRISPSRTPPLPFFVGVLVPRA